MKFIAFILFISLSFPIAGSNGGDEKSAAITLSAKVLDQFGEPVAGAKIIIRETGQTIYSDFEGSFRVQVEKKTAITFEVDMIGFEPKVIPSAHIISGEVILTSL